jgi:hypothetical protein
MAEQKPPTTLTAQNRPSWPIRALNAINPFKSRIEPEVYEQSQGITMTKFGLISPVRNKSGRAQFGEISSNYGNQFIIERPNAAGTIDSARALANNKGFVYAAVNANGKGVYAP